MCGIAGFVDLNRRTSDSQLARIVDAMRDTIANRGPDYAESWVDARVGLALGHRRLSILDLSPEGRQPMHSSGGRYTIVYNGEVFNYLDIRAELIKNGHAFRGTSDTEVMLAAFCQWGVTEAIRRFNGEFAFAVWDGQEQALTLVRDRVGVKPLYYGWAKDNFIFASELKPFRAHPTFDAEVDRDALATMLRYNYIPAPYSIYKGVFKLPAGAFLTITPGRNDHPEARRYWSAVEVARSGLENPFRGTADEAIEALEAILGDAVKIRMIADVPLGAFFSGGIDSSTVVALMQKQSSVPVKTFSIGFREALYDEAAYAKSIAAHLNTHHTEQYITTRDAVAVIPELPRLYDEPFSDHSQVPSYLVSRLARRDVTVTLSGDGGDELFAGYGHYFNALRLSRALSHLPAPIRRASAAMIEKTPFAVWGALQPLIPAAYKDALTGRRLYGLADVMREKSREGVFHEMQSAWAVDVVIGATPLRSSFDNPAAWISAGDYLDWMQAVDMVQFLPDDILVKLDRASMGVSLESRVPVLDHRVVAFAWTLPQRMKVWNTTRKWILREVLYRHVPKALVDRPKKGFGIPVGLWLRGDLRPWAEALLNGERLRREGFLDPVPVQKRWNEHLSGKIDWGHYLWNVLMFQAWSEGRAEVRAAA